MDTPEWEKPPWEEPWEAEQEPGDTPAAPPVCEARGGKPVAEFAAGAMAACLAFAWFLSRLSPSVAFGPWQGPFLSAAPVPDLPILSGWLARGVLMVCRGDAGPAARLLNILSATCGALACAMLAVAGASLCKRLATSLESFLCGVGAGVLLALTPGMTYAATAAGPTTLTVFLVLAPLALLSLRPGRARRGSVLFIASLSGGLAAANHPSFALLLLVLLVGTQAASLGRTARVWGLFVLPGFLLGAAIPLGASLAAGETMQEFLAHALQAPYPSIGDAGPHRGFGRDLLTELPLAALLAALVSFALALRDKTRTGAFLWAPVLLAMGPFLPALTNQYGLGMRLSDPAAPSCVVLAGVCLFLGVGACLLATRLFGQTKQRAGRRSLVTAATLAAVFAITFVPYPDAVKLPNRNHDMAQALGKQILGHCPEGALLISGDPALTSLAVATQSAAAYRTDVDIVATEWLVVPRYRQRLRHSLPASLVAPATFPPENAWTYWQQEQPALLKQAAQGASVDGASVDGASGEAFGPYLDLAVWDIVRDNHRERPVCFIGLSSAWLTARATPSGSTLMYPDWIPKPSVPTNEFGRIAENGLGTYVDAGFSTAMAALLLPLSHNARLQDDQPKALRLARLASKLQPKDPAPWLAMARAAARSGSKEEAVDHATECLRLMAEEDQSESQSVKELLAADFDRRELVIRLENLVLHDAETEEASGARRELTAQLWQVDELVVIEKGYARLGEQNPNDAEALYEWAAALAQLGRLPSARDALTRALELAPGEVTARIMSDGRFALLIRSHVEAPELAAREAEHPKTGPTRDRG